MQKREAKFQIWFKHWLQANWRKESAAFELKVSKTDTISMGVFRPHQLQSLLLAKTEMLYFKISDMSFSQLPFDCFVLRKSGAYVVIKFRSGVVMIDIEKLLAKKCVSLSFEDARKIGTELPF